MLAASRAPPAHYYFLSSTLFAVHFASTLTNSAVAWGYLAVVLLNFAQNLRIGAHFAHVFSGREPFRTA